MCLGIPGIIESIEGQEAVVDFGGAKRKVRVDLVDQPRIGDHVLVHAGFAIQKLTEEDFSLILTTIAGLGES